MMRCYQVGRKTRKGRSAMIQEPFGGTALRSALRLLYLNPSLRFLVIREHAYIRIHEDA
jgi:hypothetical protein